ncbi:MAG: hypothetical protein MJ072_03800, partial [Clostridia bacterium]|nr:hypothetical protein [Clostridia bacterium]
ARSTEDADGFYKMVGDDKVYAKDDVKISDISGFNMSNVVIEDIIDYSASGNDLLKTIIPAGTSLDDISSCVNDNVKNVKLTDVFTDGSDNKIVQILLKDDTVTLGNIGERINQISIEEFIGGTLMVKVEISSYTSVESETALYTFDGDKYTVVTGTQFTGYSSDKYHYANLDNSTEYYKLNPSLGVWAIVLIDDSSLSEDSGGTSDGRYGAFTEIVNSNKKLSDITGGLELGIENLKIKTLSELGLVNKISGAINDKTLSFVITTMSNLPTL